jgi:hypothetical protein
MLQLASHPAPPYHYHQSGLHHLSLVLHVRSRRPSSLVNHNAMITKRPMLVNGDWLGSGGRGGAMLSVISKKPANWQSLLASPQHSALPMSPLSSLLLPSFTTQTGGVPGGSSDRRLPDIAQLSDFNSIQPQVKSLSDSPEAKEHSSQRRM